jgi:hypothetical protein
VQCIHCTNRCNLVVCCSTENFIILDNGEYNRKCGWGVGKGCRPLHAVSLSPSVTAATPHGSQTVNGAWCLVTAGLCMTTPPITFSTRTTGEVVRAIASYPLPAPCVCLCLGLHRWVPLGTGPPQRTCNAGSPGTDVVGSNPSTAFPHGANVSNAGACCSACFNAPDCIAWVYDPAAGDSPNCWPLANYIGTTTSADRIMGVVQVRLRFRTVIAYIPRDALTVHESTQLFLSLSVPIAERDGQQPAERRRP